MNTYMDHKSIHSKIPPWIILFGQNQQIFSQKKSENFCINFSSVKCYGNSKLTYFISKTSVGKILLFLTGVHSFS